MNIGDIKAFLADKPSAERPDTAIKQQLREQGLRQAAEGVAPQVGTKTGIFSSQTTVGLRVYSNSLNQSLTIDGRQANLPTPENEKKPLFDFEEVAKNVLRFVGGVIRGAAKSGADESKLSSLFEQARTGVANGIKLAEKDLAGFMNDEIRDGIERSGTLIDDGIKALSDEIFGRSDESATSIRESTQLAYQRDDAGELQIRTRDGDVVTLRFESREQFEYNRQQLLERYETQPIEPVVTQGNPAQPSNEQNSTAAETAAPAQGAKPDNVQSDEDAANQAVAQRRVEQSYLLFEQRSVSFTVQGELDESELKAIGNLVSDANELAGDFFSGDVEKAFNKALELGFDEQELAGFALQLTRQEQSSVVQAYESVSQYNEDAKTEEAARSVKPVGDYLEKMLNVFEQANRLLENKDVYENLISSIVNELKDVGTEDLITAINRFHTFNNNLFENLPEQLAKPKVAKED